eukprot:SAG22_NODE_4144_length_1368_cov_1.855004_1_plen_60_part_00
MDGATIRRTPGKQFLDVSTDIEARRLKCQAGRGAAAWARCITAVYQARIPSMEFATGMQ